MRRKYGFGTYTTHVEIHLKVPSFNLSVCVCVGSEMHNFRLMFTGHITSLLNPHFWAKPFERCVAKIFANISASDFISECSAVHRDDSFKRYIVVVNFRFQRENIENHFTLTNDIPTSQKSMARTHSQIGQKKILIPQKHRSFVYWRYWEI